jgi:hypothetical protein
VGIDYADCLRPRRRLCSGQHGGFVSVERNFCFVVPGGDLHFLQGVCGQGAARHSAACLGIFQAQHREPLKGGLQRRRKAYLSQGLSQSGPICNSIGGQPRRDSGRIKILMLVRSPGVSTLRRLRPVSDPKITCLAFNYESGL